jgi:hypothetical protein
MKIAALCALSLGIVACSSSGGGSTSTSGGTGGHTSSSTSSSGTGGHMNACVLTTDKGNSQGVGAYCTPGGGECSKFPLSAVCLADVGQSEWFCTRIGCQMDSDCGAMATCVKQSGNSGCVPDKCLGGTDGGTMMDGGDGG